jgi:hypothetical protein
MRRRLSPIVLLLALAGALLTGCAGAKSSATGQIPESASLAPADALAYVTALTDERSDQWKTAASLLARIPGLQDGVSGLAAESLGKEGIDWTNDVRPALGPELVVVATADQEPIFLVRPESQAKLDALLAKSDVPYVRGSVDGWETLARSQTALDGYRSALRSGTLDDVTRFRQGFEALPAESVVRAWVDLSRLSKELGAVAEQAQGVDLGLDWLSAGLTAKDDGMLLTLGIPTPGDGDTRYEPVLFRRIPADAVAAVSFGGTQEALDRVQGNLDVEGAAKQIERVTGIPLGRLVDSLSGEGAFYVRRGAKLPEVTLVLAPPDPDKTWNTLDELARKLAEQANARITVRTEDGREVHRVTYEDVTVSFARLDPDTVIATTGSDGIRAFSSDGAKLVDSDGFTRAAESAGTTVGDRTRGLVYVDLDGILPLLEATGTDVPQEARDVLSALDSFVLQGTGESDVTQVQGFVRLND